MTESPTHLSYRLEPDDLARLLAAERRCACRSQCVGWAWSLAVLVPIVIALIFGSARLIGPRAALLAVGSLVGIGLAIAAAREVSARRRCRRMARDLGLPREVRVDLSPDGIVQEPDAEGAGRAFRWSDVSQVDHLADITVVRLRVADSALLIPDRAFGSPEARQAFARISADALSTRRDRDGA